MTTPDEPRIIKRADSVHTITVESLVDWCIERGLDPSKVTLTAGHLKWTSPETDAERERREQFQIESAKRRIQWENETLVRMLLDRVGPDPDDTAIRIPMTWEQYEQISGSKIEYIDGDLVIS